MGLKLMDANMIIPITEGGVTKHYITDAPHFLVTEMFLKVDSVMELIEWLNDGVNYSYQFREYTFSLKLNFDE
ncbi:hypothetical protein AVV02_gp267 [Bacillus phage AvesoBmore]|uniref:Uncharacterized protein n=1 Tax=Bacillus phage AvesoBmore TaxID=1698451 RepID=A0A0K2D0K5_9CAUD|nr:hypothetical protein AVV02_gp267 [Bacillus phage AvesoBmore]ALA13253.1 hypothetical protein AVESOBMORE_267 [Bacillus phage AvesoBmore]ULF48885.1 hypothetical protein [Bacillus phage BillyBob]